MKRFLIACGAVLLACHSPTAPTDSVNKVTGRLSGIVKIGPNCPVEQPGNPCPTPPSAYTLRKILVFDEQRTRLLATVDIDTQGLYLIDLAPARYLVDIKGVGLDRSTDVPKVVEIHASSVTTLNISIDTGLR
ncbi:MAG TPA: hypothetical protein VKL19_12225 [Thermoanaerobaculia bacterium]|nr:hypothetical protein [Thermoanaerobaculia bacterium]